MLAPVIESATSDSTQFFQAVVRMTNQPGTWTGRKQLIARYESWCRQNGHRPMSDKGISKMLRQLFQKPRVLQTKLSATGSLQYVGMMLTR